MTEGKLTQTTSADFLAASPSPAILRDLVEIYLSFQGSLAQHTADCGLQERSNKGPEEIQANSAVVGRA